MIRIQNLKKSYSSLDVLKDINLNISKGTIHGLVGTSGVGKSTLLRTINGIEKVDSGKLSVMGKNIPDLNELELSNIRKNISMIFQNFALMESKNVFENIAFPMRIWNYSDSEINERVDSILKMVGIEDKKYSKPKNLSGGQRQRVAIARALTLKPQILLSDEATSGLDPVTASNIIKLLIKISNELGITMIFVTHQMDMAKQICDSISIMKGGEIVETDTVENIFMRNSEYLRDLVGALKLNIENSNKKTVFRLFLSSEVFSFPVLHFLGQNDIDFTLEYSQLDIGKHGRFGSLYVSVHKEESKKAYTILKQVEGLIVNYFDLEEGLIINV